MKTKVFTYGSLMSDLGNHIVMIRAQGRFISKARVNGLDMRAYCAGFPACYEGEDSSATGEVYEVEAEGLKQLDMLEGEGSFYHRVKMTTTDGEEVEVYIIKGEAKGEIVPDGDWRAWKEARGHYRPSLRSRGFRRSYIDDLMDWMECDKGASK